MITYLIYYCITVIVISNFFHLLDYWRSEEILSNPSIKENNNHEKYSSAADLDQCVFVFACSSKLYQ